MLPEPARSLRCGSALRRRLGARIASAAWPPASPAATCPSSCPSRNVATCRPFVLPAARDLLLKCCQSRSSSPLPGEAELDHDVESQHRKQEPGASGHEGGHDREYVG